MLQIGAAGVFPSEPKLKDEWSRGPLSYSVAHPHVLQAGWLCDVSSKRRTAVGRGLQVVLLSTSDLF